jgi:hypothetical protein
MLRAIAFSLVLLLASPAYATVYLNHNPGGNVGEFMQDVESVGQSGDNVVINGACASSCTLYLALGSRVCVTTGAVMGFHSPFYPIPDGSRGHTARDAIPVFMSSYPPALQAWINAHGGLTARPLLLKGTQLVKLGVRACSAERVAA